MNKTFNGHTPNENSLLDLDRSDTNIHNVEAKRCRVDNDSATYLWHCRLGHIGVKRMKKLHTDGLLESLDYESLGTCEPCLMGKMTKTPFSGTTERATDLLEIIHTDVCGPMSVEAHGGLSGKLIHEQLWDRRTEPLSVRRGAEVARRADRGEAHEQFTQLRSSPER